MARDISSMRRKMEEEVGKESERHYNIKQGAGGLVDIEFIVQFLQLLHGKQHQAVRIPGTYNALRVLKRQGILDEESSRILIQAYQFTRRLESRMRIVNNQATSELSRDPGKLLPLALRMGYPADDASAGLKLLGDYELMRSQVRFIFDMLLRQ